MSYDDDFYQKYHEYLNEPTVSRLHGFAISSLLRDRNIHNLLDLGCGRSHEILLRFPLGLSGKYIGLDVNAASVVSVLGNAYTVRLDYRTPGLLTDWLDPKKDNFCKTYFDTFVSLFSSELTGTPEENYELYGSIFNSQQNIRTGLVSGFYYSDRKNESIVQEVGGITSHQSIENMSDFVCPEFTEFRLTMPVPSELFGQNVFEVWKLFTRNS